jgi:DNA-binding MarR family transcriptional regulator
MRAGLDDEAGLETMTMTAGPGYRETGLGWPEVMAPADQSEPASAAEQDHAGLSQEAGGPALEAGLGFRLGRAHRMLRAAWEETIADLELSPPQAALLRSVAQRPGCGLRELARLMHTDAMNAKRLADRLERAGLLASSADPGHRQRRVLRLTGPGAALAGELARRAAEQQQALAYLIGPAEVARLLDLLGRLELAVASGLPPAPAAAQAAGQPSDEGGHR